MQEMPVKQLLKLDVDSDARTEEDEDLCTDSKCTTAAIIDEIT